MAKDSTSNSTERDCVELCHGESPYESSMITRLTSLEVMAETPQYRSQKVFEQLPVDIVKL